MYAAAGAVGIALLVPIAVVSGSVSIPLVAAGSTLVAISAVGLSEEDRRTKIGAGIAAGTATIINPRALVFVAKEAYGATKETVKQGIELAKTGIGLTTASMGLVSSALVTCDCCKKKKVE